MGHPPGLSGRHRKTRHAPLGTSLYFRLAWAGWGCRRPRAPDLQRTGRPGPMLSLCSARGARPSRSGRSAASLTRMDQHASEQPLRPVGCLQPKGGQTCLPASSWRKEHVRLTDLKGPPSPVNGSTGGNTVRRVHGTSSSATTCCCPLCHLPTARSCAPKLVRTPLLGSRPSPATPTPRSPRRQCRSRCVADSGSHFRSHQAAAGAPRSMGADAALMHSACPRTGLLARRAKLVERAWCKVAGEAVGPEGHVVPQQWFVNTTAAGIVPDDRPRLDLVIYGAAQLGGVLCCDATLP